MPDIHSPHPDQPPNPAGEVAADVRQLGEPTASFDPARGRLIGRIVAGAVTAATGVVLLALVARPATVDWPNIPGDDRGIGWNRPAVVGVGTAGLVAVVTGAGVIVWARRDLASRVYLCPGGCYRVRPGRWRVCPWDRVAGIRFYYPWPPRWEVPDVAVPPGSAGCSVTQIEVRLRSGQEVAFTDSTVRDLTGLAVRFRAEADRRGIPWDVYRP